MATTTELTETEKRVLRKFVRPNNLVPIQTRLLHHSIQGYGIDLNLPFVDIYDVVESLCEKGLLVEETNITYGMAYRIV